MDIFIVDDPKKMFTKLKTISVGPKRQKLNIVGPKRNKDPIFYAVLQSRDRDWKGCLALPQLTVKNVSES